MHPKFKVGDLVCIESGLAQALELDPGKIYPVERSCRPPSDYFYYTIIINESRVYFLEKYLYPCPVSNLDKGHETHEIIDNIVLHKSFKYCRTCKTEV